jgi:uncharacterized protein YprB with RNaseH-like and TPR domain
MPSLSEKLKSLGVKVGAHDLPRPAPKTDVSIETVLGGEVRSNLYGDAYLVEALHAYGNIYDQEGLQFPHALQTLAAWAGIPELEKYPGERYVFLDIETTGLAGGTGVYPFLVGIGHFQADGFRLHQFFMRTPLEEAALLAGLSEAVANDKILVTYNGKSFDAPILATRYTLNGLTNPLSDLIHLDLLALARRLWRDRLPSRALGYLECAVLGIVRAEEEVPGWMIPQMYFDYLQSGDARPMKGVVYHNAMDILSLAALFQRIDRMLADPLNQTAGETLDLVAIGKLHEALGHHDTAVELYNQGLSTGLPEENHWDTVQRLANLYKQKSDYESAISLWQQAAENKQLYAFVELAKYFEHHAKDEGEALKWTEQALELVKMLPVTPYRRKEWAAELNCRAERLRRKLGII